MSKEIDTQDKVPFTHCSCCGVLKSELSSVIWLKRSKKLKYCGK